MNGPNNLQWSRQATECCNNEKKEEDQDEDEDGEEELTLLGLDFDREKKCDPIGPIIYCV